MIPCSAKFSVHVHEHSGNQVILAEIIKTVIVIAVFLLFVYSTDVHIKRV